MRVHLNPITGSTKAYNRLSQGGSALPVTDSQRAMRILSNPHSDRQTGPDELDYMRENSGSFNLVDMKIALDPDA